MSKFNFCIRLPNYFLDEVANYNRQLQGTLATICSVSKGKHGYLVLFFTEEPDVNIKATINRFC